MMAKRSPGRADAFYPNSLNFKVVAHPDSVACTVAGSALLVSQGARNFYISTRNPVFFRISQDALF